MKTDLQQRKYLQEYNKPDFTITSTTLDFALSSSVTRVRSCLHVVRQSDDLMAPLVLDGVDLKVIELQIDDEYLDDPDFSYDGSMLTIPGVPHEFDFIATVEINPAANTRLEGLFLSNGNYCTQCEPEGFRHITFYIDRPDVMSVFTTTIHADKDAFPVLLSNGNKVDSGDKGDQHWVKWFDPFPKPSYLFALVAGDLACISGSFTTGSGRNIVLEFYTEHHNREKCGHALSSLERAMRWDEQKYGLEYDLDLYMVVAVDDFNMGAMENKGLNVFNTKYVLANRQTATDDDFLNIEGVIAHEYFHNWTGNRVTCRDWFQLSLKEGLTVYRDQEFSSDMMSRAIQRINDVRALRAHQFTEDAGPMAHPVRPQSYLEINNFYTTTIYNKGAEVVRMYETLLGEQGFRKGMDLYFDRFDGQAVTTDDFRMAMQDANDADLSQFQRWYDQAGTPVVNIKRIYDSESSTLRLWLKQDAGHTRGEPNEPFIIPLRLALFDQSGAPLDLNKQGDKEQVFDISQVDQTLEFQNIPELPLVSAFRGFSAPVIIQSDLSLPDLAILMACETDSFNQWDAGQQYAIQVMMQLIEAERIEVTESLHTFCQAYSTLLANSRIDRSLLAEMLRLPGEKFLAELCIPADIQKIHQARHFVKQQLANHLESQLMDLYQDCDEKDAFEITPAAMGKRSLKNICLDFLTMLQQDQYYQMAEQQFTAATNMTDQIGSLTALVDADNDLRERLFNSFYSQWSDTALVVDKWFQLQASSQSENALQDIMALEKHSAFNLKNPNRVRSLLGAFQANTVVFNDPSGRGYEFLADKIIELDRLNPQIASRLSAAFLNWKKLIPSLGDLMKQQVVRIQASPGLSNDVAELMSSSLADSDE